MFGLPDTVLGLIRDYFARRPEVMRAVIYGSRAMEKYETGSDIDLAIWTDGEKNMAAKIKSELEDLSTPYLFDVTDYMRIGHRPLRQHIDRVGKEIYVRSR